MSPELDDALCKKYPEIFVDRRGKPSATAMCWGFDCGDGWYAIIDVLCGLLMNDAYRAKQDYETVREIRERIDGGHDVTEWARAFYTTELLEQRRVDYKAAVAAIPRALQVKEKFGGLCFYVSGTTDEQSAFIHMAETMSYRTCEYCGTTKDARARNDRWVRTLCSDCARNAGYTLENDDAPAPV